MRALRARVQFWTVASSSNIPETKLENASNRRHGVMVARRFPTHGSGCEKARIWYCVVISVECSGPWAINDVVGPSCDSKARGISSSDTQSSRSRNLRIRSKESSQYTLARCVY